MKLFFGVLGALAAASLLLAGWTAAPSIRLMTGGEQTEGEVVEVRELRGPRPLRTPVVQFRANGRIVRGQLAASAAPAYLKGDRLSLYYAVESPERFVVADFGQMWQRPALAAALALALIAAAWMVRLSMQGVKEPVIFAGAFNALGALLLAAALWMSLSQWLELRRAIHTMGTVTNARGEPWRLFRSGAAADLPAEISFTTTAGRQARFVDASINARYRRPEDLVHVFYDQDRPQHARVAAFVPLWLNKILVAVFALAAIGAGFAIRLLLRT